MCAIAGVWTFDGATLSPAARLQFLNSMRHRGPDGYGESVLDGGALWLGHRRLAILDLSEHGRQPLAETSGRYWVTFNGEIYNFLELRGELEALGHRFRTATDTEVIAVAYSQWGAQCQLKFNGMWAFAVWDAHEGQLFLSRDRFGEKPLYYSASPQQFVFASELKAFSKFRDCDRRVDWEVVGTALDSSFVVEGQERTLLAGVRKLLPGHQLQVDPRRIVVRRWWQTLEHLPNVPGDFEDQALQFRALFEDACRLRTRSDVPIVSCLSGGLDSSAVVSTVAQCSSRWKEGRSPLRSEKQRAFVATFPGSFTDEERFARTVIEAHNVAGEFCPLDLGADAALVEKVVYDCEDVFLNVPLAIWQTYKALRSKGVYVSLDGHGADEGFGGYPQHVTAALMDTRGLAEPFRVIELAGTLNAMLGTRSQWPRLSIWPQVLKRTPGAKALRTLRPRRKKIAPSRTWNHLSKLPGNVQISPQGGSHLQRALFSDVHATVLPTLLRVFDRASMAHGVEVRMPFLDWRLVTFAFALPDRSKIGGGFSKRIVRHAMRDVVPDEVRLRRHKIGFASPMHLLFSGGLAEWLLDVTRSSEFQQATAWDGKAISEFVLLRSRNRDWSYHSAERVWPYINAHLAIKHLTRNSLIS